MKNSADQGGCYPQRPTKADFLLLKGVSPLRSLFFCSPDITQPCPQVFSVNGLIICGRLCFGHPFDVIGSIIFGGLWTLLTSLIQYGEDSFKIW